MFMDANAITGIPQVNTIAIGQALKFFRKKNTPDIDRGSIPGIIRPITAPPSGQPGEEATHDLLKWVGVKDKRPWQSGHAPAFQVGQTGSIPVGRSS